MSSKGVPRRGQIDGHFSFPELAVAPFSILCMIKEREIQKFREIRQASGSQARPVLNGAADQIPGDSRLPSIRPPLWQGLGFG